MANIDLCNNCPAFQPKLECVSIPKIFDQCRLQVCLTPNEIGAAKIDFNPINCNINKNTCPNQCGQSVQGKRTSCSGETIVPPQNAVSVTIDNFCIKSMNVLSKTKSGFRKGFFDVSIRFIFSYTLKFYNADNMEISRVPACSSYTTTVSLYGGEDICVASFNELYNGITTNGPFVSIEGSAMNLAAALRYPCSCGCGCGCGYGCGSCGGGCGCSDNGCDNGCSCLSPTGVDVTIGLFAVVKLLRLSNMSVNSYGNCMPCECSDISDISPCDFFDNLKFPTDLFAPQANYKPCCDTSSEDTPTNGSCCETC